MMLVLQAITTKYLEPTNCRGSRIKAECAALAKMYFWDERLDCAENHAAAAERLAKQLMWLSDAVLHGGVMKDGRYVWVLVPRENLRVNLLTDR